MENRFLGVTNFTKDPFPLSIVVLNQLSFLEHNNNCAMRMIFIYAPNFFLTFLLRNAASITPTSKPFLKNDKVQNFNATIFLILSP